ncbi:MAG: hypothetical protein QM751_13395 [Paludibacteraceae bacterium]
MKKILIIVTLLSFVTGLSSQKWSEINYLDSIHRLEQSMEYQALIRFVGSLPDKNVITLQAQARAQLSLGLVHDAFTTMGLATTLFPQDMKMLGDFADMSLSVGNSDLALIYLNKATAISRQLFLMNKKAEILYSKKMYALSLTVIDSVLINSVISSAIRLKSKNLAALNNTPEAIRVLENQYKKDKNDYLTFRQLSFLYLATDSFAKLIGITDNYLKTDSLNTEILSLNGKANYLNDDYTRAIKVYDKLEAMTDNFDYDQSFFAAMSFYRANDSLIYKAYNYMIKADSLSETERYPLKYYLAKMAEKTGKTEVAERYFKEAIQLIEPDTNQLAQVLNNLGKIQMLNRKPYDAIENYLQTLKHKPHDTTALLGAGLAYEYIQDYNQALKYYEQVVSLLPDTVSDAYSNKADQRIKYLKKKFLQKIYQKKK